MEVVKGPRNKIKEWRKMKGSRIAKINSKKNKLGKFTCSDIEMFCKSIMIMTVSLAIKEKKVEKESVEQN